MDEIIAQSGNWRLVDHHRDGNGWRSLKLEYTGPRRRKPYGKRTWWFGWNGERLARSTDAGRLARDWPDILEWVEAELSKLSGHVSPGRANEAARTLISEEEHHR